MKLNKKLFALICVVLAAVLIGAAVTAALLVNNSNGIRNTFVGGTVGCVIEEDITTTPGVKANVKLKNDGTFASYLRACLVVNWIDEDGNFYPETPEAGVDYTVETPSPFGFVADGNFYYCKETVAPGETSPVLFTEISPIEGRTPAGYTLSVEILGSAIQSSFDAAVENAWGVTVRDGTIIR